MESRTCLTSILPHGAAASHDDDPGVFGLGLRSWLRQGHIQTREHRESSGLPQSTSHLGILVS